MKSHIPEDLISFVWRHELIVNNEKTVHAKDYFEYLLTIYDKEKAISFFIGLFPENYQEVIRKICEEKV